MCLERACHTAACKHECVCLYRVQESISWDWGSVGGLGVGGIGRVVRLQAAVGVRVFAGAQHHLLGLPRLYHFIHTVLDHLHWSRMAAVPLGLSLSFNLGLRGGESPAVVAFFCRIGCVLSTVRVLKHALTVHSRPCPSG